MKRRIAVCSNGWSNDYLKIVLSGMKECAKEHNVDIFLLLNYGVSDGEEYRNIGDANIYRLLDYNPFDGVIFLTNTFHLQEEFEYIQEKFQNSNIPSVSLENPLEHIDYIGSDNYSGMYDLCTRLIEDHDVKNILFISGPKGNSESETRQKALEDAMQEHGLSLDQEHILCGNWNYYEIDEFLPSWLKEHSSLPDAIVCANDIMAMGVCTVLRDLNISVPKTVKVTGFDYLESGITHTPSISTVDRNWTNLGYQSMQHILDKIDGKPTPSIQNISSKAVLAESSGHSIVQDLREEIKPDNSFYDQLINLSFWVGYLCDIAHCLSQVSSEEELHTSYNNFLVNNHLYEGDELYVCLGDNFFSTLRDNTPLQNIGYTKKTNVICGIRNGQPVQQVLIDTANIIPDYDFVSEKTKLYTLTPMYSTDGCYGYLVFGNETPMLYDFRLFNWARNFKQNLTHIRHNIALTELNKRLSVLSLTDGLTGIYNRMGCEKIAYPYLEECHRQNERAVMMFADINKMKDINDKYGHLQGDTAISTVAHVIKDILTDDWIHVRYGGDEFLMVGKYSEDQPPEQLSLQITKHLEETSKQMQLPFSLTASVGYVIVEPSENLDLSDYLKKADEAMYAMKQKNKK